MRARTRSARAPPIRGLCPAATVYEIVTPPAHGTATGGAELAYHAAAGYVGPDSFTYRALAPDGRMIDGRAVTARASAGGQVKLVVRRGKLPTRRKVAWMRVSGTATGADGRVRNAKLTLR